jgi:osmotically-inducible protein OsmY
MSPKSSTYDDLVRGVVPMPDSSHRPTRAEAEAAESRPPGPLIKRADPADRSPDPDEVRDALDALVGADLSDLDISLDGGRAILDGSVATQDDRDRIVRVVGCVRGVTTVIDTLRVRL